MMFTGNQWHASPQAGRHGRHVTTEAALMIDYQETQIQLQKGWKVLTYRCYLFPTHYHADHISGLPGLLLTTGNSEKEALNFVGPKGLAG